ncbi:MAG: ATPase domain-containing protein, partial [Candidatus Methanofastidiosia archaeon]
VSLMLTEKKSGLDNLVFDKFDFMADGIFLLDRETRRQGDRYLLSIQKMRTTDINSVPRPFRFTKNGITLFPDEPIL